MSDNLPRPDRAPEGMTPNEAARARAQIETAIGAGTVRETPRVDARLDRLAAAEGATRAGQGAGQLPSQVQRDAARAAAPSPQAPSPADASAQRQQMTPAAPRSRI